jgi:hypothetical protein
MLILAWNGALGAMWKIVTTETVAIQDITGIITALEEAALTINLVLKTAATNTTEIPMPIVQEEPVILLLPILCQFQNQVTVQAQSLARELIAEQIVRNLTLRELLSL